MKKSIRVLAAIAILAPCLPVATHAATQVYDVSADSAESERTLTGLLPATQRHIAFDTNVSDTGDNRYLDDIRLVGTK
jgi:hypothetical protein